jgi:hypothetical protein
MQNDGNKISFDIISPEGKANALAERVKARRLEMNLTQEGQIVWNN